MESDGDSDGDLDTCRQPLIELLYFYPHHQHFLEHFVNPRFLQTHDHRPVERLFGQVQFCEKLPATVKCRFEAHFGLEIIRKLVF
jgi:hypothetical protein